MTEEEKVVRELVETMLTHTERTEAALQDLTLTVLDRYEIIERLVSELRVEVKHLSTILVGKTGDNGLTTRVKMLERSRGHVSWAAVGLFIGLILAAIGVWFK